MSNDLTNSPQQENPEGLWNTILVKAMEMPMVAVNREKFLYNAIGPYTRSPELLQKAINGNPLDYIPKNVIDEIVSSCIKNRRLKVTGLSVAAGMPGGFAMLGTIPADLAQFYFHIFKSIQEIAYLYGYPSFTGEDDSLNPGMEHIITIFVGGMLGVTAAESFIRSLTPKMAKRMAYEIGKKALTKTTWYPIAKNIAKHIGINLTKATASRTISKIVPIIGGAVSGGLSYAMFSNMSKRLVKLLDNQYYIAQQNQ